MQKIIERGRRSAAQHRASGVKRFRNRTRDYLVAVNSIRKERALALQLGNPKRQRAVLNVDGKPPHAKRRKAAWGGRINDLALAVAEAEADFAAKAARRTQWAAGVMAQERPLLDCPLCIVPKIKTPVHSLLPPLPKEWVDPKERSAKREAAVNNPYTLPICPFAQVVRQLEATKGVHAFQLQEDLMETAVDVARNSG